VWDGELMKSRKKPTTTMDIVIFGICLFIILLLREYHTEVGDTVMWVLSIPLGMAGLFFGYRAMNQEE
jgi:hypothetical protein